jgi:hypothetical protein
MLTADSERREGDIPFNRRGAKRFTESGGRGILNRVDSPIGRFFGSRDDVPEWARFFDVEGYTAFLDAVRKDMERRKTPYELGEGTLHVAPPGEEEADYGLLNLAQLCNACPRRDWERAVRDHFDNAFRCTSEAEELDARSGSFEGVSSLLKVRLYHTDYLEQMGADRLVHRIPAEGLVETLVYDLPGSVRTVPAEHAARWGKGTDELLEAGLANVKAEPRPTPQVFKLDQGAAFRAIVGDSFFTASHALFLEEYLGKATEFGEVVSVPHRHAVLFHAIEDARAMTAIQSLIAVTFGMYQEGPGSISPSLYWRRGGSLTPLPSRVTAQSVTFSPPDLFVDEVLNRLS